MYRMKMATRVGLAILLGLSILGTSPESSSQSTRALDLAKYEVRNRIQASGFITSKPISSWGAIVGSKDKMVNLGEGDVVYVELDAGKEVKAGDRFSIARLGRVVTDPVSKKKIGNLVVIAGELVILEGKEKVVSVKVEKSYRSIYPGDKIIPPGAVMPAAMPTSIPKKIEGMVITTQEEINNITQNEIIFINRGSQDGVIVGNLFSIYQKGHYGKEILERTKVRLPMAKVGEAVVISVQEETCAAIVTLSSQAIYVGDKVISGGE